jgi:hypothetical protein
VQLIPTDDEKISAWMHLAERCLVAGYADVAVKSIEDSTKLVNERNGDQFLVLCRQLENGPPIVQAVAYRSQAYTLIRLKRLPGQSSEYQRLIEAAFNAWTEAKAPSRGFRVLYDAIQETAAIDVTLSTSLLHLRLRLFGDRISELCAYIGEEEQPYREIAKNDQYHPSAWVEALPVPPAAKVAAMRNLLRKCTEKRRKEFVALWLAEMRKLGDAEFISRPEQFEHAFSENEFESALNFARLLASECDAARARGNLAGEVRRMLIIGTCMKSFLVTAEELAWYDAALPAARALSDDLLAMRFESLCVERRNHPLQRVALMEHIEHGLERAKNLHSQRWQYKFLTDRLQLQRYQPGPGVEIEWDAVVNDAEAAVACCSVAAARVNGRVHALMQLADALTQRARVPDDTTRALAAYDEAIALTETPGLWVLLNLSALELCVRDELRTQGLERTQRITATRESYGSGYFSLLSRDSLADFLALQGDLTRPSATEPGSWVDAAKLYRNSTESSSSWRGWQGMGDCESQTAMQTGEWTTAANAYYNALREARDIPKRRLTAQAMLRCLQQTKDVKDLLPIVREFSRYSASCFLVENAPMERLVPEEGEIRQWLRKSEIEIRQRLMMNGKD